MNRVKLAAARKRVMVQLDNLDIAIAKDIAAILEDNQMTQTEASYATGEAPSQISLVVTGKLRGFSTRRLLRMRAMLGAAITLKVTPSSQPSVAFSN